MASSKTAGDQPSECASAVGSRAESRSSTPLQRLLTQGAGIPMPGDHSKHVSEDLALFTPEERRELQRGNAEQCEANR
jgi:hypothetical protein